MVERNSGSEGEALARVRVVFVGCMRVGVSVFARPSVCQLSVYL